MPQLSRPSSLPVYTSRRLIVQRLMQPLVVIEREEFTKTRLRLGHCPIIVDENILVFDRPPQPLNEDIVEKSPPTIHADLNPGILQPPEVILARKLRPLVRVGYLRASLAKSLIKSRHAEVRLQRI